MDNLRESDKNVETDDEHKEGKNGSGESDCGHRHFHCAGVLIQAVHPLHFLYNSQFKAIRNPSDVVTLTQAFLYTFEKTQR